MIAPIELFSIGLKRMHNPVDAQRQVALSSSPPAAPDAIAHGGPVDDPALPPSLAAALQRAAQTAAGIRYIDAAGAVKEQSYAELLAVAQQVSRGLQARQIDPGSQVVIQCQPGPDFIAALWGCFLAAVVPVPIAPPLSYDSPLPLRYALEQLGVALVITDAVLEPDLKRFLASGQSSTQTEAITLDQLCRLENSRLAERQSDVIATDLDQLALLLLTSGSTGTPKGVMLSPRNLLVSASGMAQVNQLSDSDITLNWMPLEHVASLVMFHLTEVCLGCQQIHVNKEYILKAPLTWLDLIEQHHVTATWAPNFAYGLVNDQVATNPQRRWDLSSIRWMGNGAEAVVGATTRRFLQLLAPHGLAETAVSPGYGMSETCSGIVHSHRFSLATSADDDPFVEVGEPIPGLSVRLVDEQDRLVRSGSVGRLQVKGLTVTSGYYQRPDLNAEVFTADGWFNTGDLGFLQDGRLTITGREKEVIVLNGVNYYSHEIEAVVEAIAPIESSFTAACGVRRPGAPSDQLAIFFHSAIADEKALIDLLKTIRQQVLQALGISPTYLIPVEPADIPKTAIGKIQRSVLVQRFSQGKFDPILQRLKGLMTPAAGRPLSGVENAIATVWQSVLAVETVGLHDNFFELGGNSLKLMQVLQQLQTQVSPELTAVDLFQHATVAALASHLRQPLPRISPAQPAKPPSRTAQSSQAPADIAPADIAVVGMACRFPGANSLDEFWQNLCAGVESIATLSDAEILAAGVNPSLLKNPDYVRASPILDQVDAFDADFFGYQPKEAELIDPQQRLLLECAWESLEHAGYDPLSYPGDIGLYAGASMNTYLLNQVYPQRHQLDPNDPMGVVNLSSMGGFQMTVANDKDYLTTRVSYKLNLRGPSVNVQTACSTALVAIHLAAQSVRNGECDMALAGGVSVHTPQTVGYLFHPGMILSPDGHCRAFDAQAQGTLFGSGAGLVVLKRLAEAQADGDAIYAVIKGSAIGNDGGGKVGYLAPRSEGQTAVAAAAIAQAQIPAESIGYVEAHGTGTALGDPVEIAGLTQAFSTQKRQFCAIGSVKTNVGHLNIASGVVGFIKTVLALHHRQQPPSLHFESPNPQIDFANSPFYVNTALTDWPQDSPRRASVNSLGIGGTNAHVVLEAAPEPIAAPESRTTGQQLLTLSAKSLPALQSLVAQYQTFLSHQPEISLPDLCFTANAGRAHFAHRLAIAAHSVPQLQSHLKDYLADRENPAYRIGHSPQPHRPTVVFLFTGQGSQSVGMGQDLYQTQPVFRQSLDRCADILRSQNILLLDLLFDSTPDRLNRTENTQPALFALEYALAQLWQSWGIQPAAMLGHSLGEYVAACLAGVFSLEDGLRLVAGRARLMQVLPAGGAMVAVRAGAEQVRSAILLGRGSANAQSGRKAAIAALNGPENTVISGATENLANVVTALTAQRIKTQPLKVSQAFHSSLMQPMLADFAQLAETVTYHPPQIPLVSNVTGELATDEMATPAYWCRHIQQPVQFASGMETLLAMGCDTFIECGPKPTLLSLGRSLITAEVSWLPSLRPNQPDEQVLFDSLSQLYVRGVAIDWSGFAAAPRRRLPLPTYPFQRQRYWIDAKPSSIVAPDLSQAHPLLGEQISTPLAAALYSTTSDRIPDFLLEHRLRGRSVLSATAYLEMAIAAGQSVLKTKQLELRNVVFQQFLSLDSDLALQTIVQRQSEGVVFEVHSRPEMSQDAWTLHCQGEIATISSAPQQAVDLSQIQQTLTPGDVQEHYQTCQALGLKYGPTYQSIQQLWRRSGETLAQVDLSEPAQVSEYQLHPALLDACFQAVLAALPTPMACVPVRLKRLRLYRSPGSQLWSHVRLQSQAESVTADVTLLDAAGAVIGEVNGLVAQPMALAPAEVPDWQHWLYQVDWQRQILTNSEKNRVGGAFPKENRAHWLIFADSQGIAEQVSTQLPSYTLVTPGKSYQAENNRVQIDPKQPEDFQRLLVEYPAQGILYYWSLANLPPQANGTELKIMQQNCQAALYLVQALLSASSINGRELEPPRIWWVTRSARQVESVPTGLNVAQAPLWGLAQTLALEHPELQSTLIDLEVEATAQAAQHLLNEILADTAEPQIAFRDGDRYVARLVQSTLSHEQTEDGSAQQLKISARGSLENLAWQTVSRRFPGPPEVEIQVQAAGLNFRDVLNALNRYPGEPGPLGLECAGRIVAVGAAVRDLSLGDEVIAIAPASLSQYVTVPAALVIPRPGRLSPAEAATLPVTFLTAHYALRQLAQIQPGDRVLIHSAAGGVGQAAIQIAQQAGAEIFATASPPKWDSLKALGVRHVYNSRSLDFAEQIQAKGHQIDIVLNALSGDFIAKSLSLLGQGGRFLELGKTDIWSDAQMAQVRPDVAYHVIDLVQITQQQPQRIQAMLSDLMPQFQTGQLTPLPHRTFASDRAVEAFRWMQQAKHIGKVVIAPEPPAVGWQGTYLVTGGLGALGLQVAQWLAQQGVQQLLLIGRNSPTSVAKSVIEQIEQAGTPVAVAQADVSNRTALAELLQPYRQGPYPLRGIIHAAGLIDDATLPHQSWEKFARVMAAKVQGSWHLHQLTLDWPLDRFVLFSSAASLLGSAGQANYAAANAFMDASAHHRRSQGRPAVSINWAAWQQSGLAKSDRAQQRLAAQQLKSLESEQGLAILTHLLSHSCGTTQVGVLPGDIADWLRIAEPAIRADLTPTQTEPAHTSETTIQQQLAALSPDQQQEFLLEILRSQIAKVLGIPPSTLTDPHQGFTDLGMDSLTSVELRNRLQTTLTHP
ncbi:SDR family NAD(P)-dependent oxidoreductase, partial [Romeria aff. gracilis LEGE 07310]